MKNKSPKKNQSPTSHTPGPWRSDDSLRHDFIPVYGMNGGQIAAVVSPVNKSAPNSAGEANALLISAATDLLAFAVDFLDFIDDPNMEMSELKKRAKAAILKAKGRK